VGEFNTRIILQEWGVPEEEARQAAEGWGGDAYKAFEGPGGALAFAWATVWDTDRDAAEFAAACSKAKGVLVVREATRVMLTKGVPPRAGGRRRREGEEMNHQGTKAPER